MIILLFYLTNLFRSLVCFEKVLYVIYKLNNGVETWRNLNHALLYYLLHSMSEASSALFKLIKEA